MVHLVLGPKLLSKVKTANQVNSAHARIEVNIDSLSGKQAFVFL